MGITNRPTIFRPGLCKGCASITLFVYYVEDGDFFTFEHPLCAEASHEWQRRIDGVWYTAQTGGDTYVPTGGDRYRLMYICDGCPYTQEFSANECDEVSEITLTVEDCTYFIRGHHPDTGVQAEVKVTFPDDSVTLTTEINMKYQNSCNNDFSDDIQSIQQTTSTQFRTVTANTLQVGGHAVSMRVHIYDGTIPGVTGDVTVPLAPGTAMLTGCAGTVLAGDLTYNGSNSTAWITAVRNVAVNYLCSLGYAENTNFIATAAPGLTNSPVFRARKNPAGIWLGIRTGTPAGENEYVVDRFGDGSEIVSSGTSGSGGALPFNMDFTRTVESPCGNVVRGERWQTSLILTNWYTINYNFSTLNSLLTNTEQTCVDDALELTSVCELTNISWQKFNDPVWDEVQDGGSIYVLGEETGDFRAQAYCGLCEVYSNTIQIL